MAQFTKFEEIQKVSAEVMTAVVRRSQILKKPELFERVQTSKTLKLPRTLQLFKPELPQLGKLPASSQTSVMEKSFIFLTLNC